MIMNGLSQGGGSDSRVPVIYTTSYVGTGTYGQNNPNTLTFDFVPEIVIISQSGELVKTWASSDYIYTDPVKLIFMVNQLPISTTYIQGYTYVYRNSGESNGAGTRNLSYRHNSNNSIQWYCLDNNNLNDGNILQRNYSGHTYHVLALGYKEES